MKRRDYNIQRAQSMKVDTSVFFVWSDRAGPNYCVATFNG